MQTYEQTAADLTAMLLRIEDARLREALNHYVDALRLKAKKDAPAVSPKEDAPARLVLRTCCWQCNPGCTCSLPQMPCEEHASVL